MTVHSTMAATELLSRNLSLRSGQGQADCARLIMAMNHQSLMIRVLPATPNKNTTVANTVFRGWLVTEDALFKRKLNDLPSDVSVDKHCFMDRSVVRWSSPQVKVSGLFFSLRPGGSHLGQWQWKLVVREPGLGASVCNHRKGALHIIVHQK